MLMTSCPTNQLTDQLTSQPASQPTSLPFSILGLNPAEVWQPCCFIHGQEDGGEASDLCVRVRMCVYVCVRARGRACTGVCARARTCGGGRGVWEHIPQSHIYDPNQCNTALLSTALMSVHNACLPCIAHTHTHTHTHTEMRAHTHTHTHTHTHICTHTHTHTQHTHMHSHAAPHLHSPPVAGIRHVTHEDGVAVLRHAQQQVAQALLGPDERQRLRNESQKRPRLSRKQEAQAAPSSRWPSWDPMSGSACATKAAPTEEDARCSVGFLGSTYSRQGVQYMHAFHTRQ